MENLEEMNWGFHEIAQFKIIKDSKAVGKYSSCKVPLIESEFRWENERRIRIISAKVKIEELGR